MRDALREGFVSNFDWPCVCVARVRAGLWSVIMSDEDEAKSVDLRDADIDEKNLERIEAMDELLRNAPKESRQINWGLAQARAVVGVLEEKQLEP